MEQPEYEVDGYGDDNGDIGRLVETIIASVQMPSPSAMVVTSPGFNNHNILYSDIELERCKTVLLSVINMKDKLKGSELSPTYHTNSVDVEYLKQISTLEEKLINIKNYFPQCHDYSQTYVLAVKSNFYSLFCSINCTEVVFHNLFNIQFSIFKALLSFMLMYHENQSIVQEHFLTDSVLSELSFTFNYLISHYCKLEFSLLMEHEVNTIKNFLCLYIKVIQLYPQLISCWISCDWIVFLNFQLIRDHTFKHQVDNFLLKNEVPIYDILIKFFQNTNDFDMIRNISILTNLKEDNKLIIHDWFLSKCDLFSHLIEVSEKVLSCPALSKGLEYSINCITYIISNCWKELANRLISQLQFWILKHLYTTNLGDASVLVNILFNFSSNSDSPKYINTLLANSEISKLLVSIPISSPENYYYLLATFLQMIRNDSRILFVMFSDEYDHLVEIQIEYLTAKVYFLYSNDIETIYTKLAAKSKEASKFVYNFGFNPDLMPVKILLKSLLRFFINDSSTNEVILQLNELLLIKINLWNNEIYESIIKYLFESCLTYKTLIDSFIDEEQYFKSDLTEDAVDCYYHPKPDDKLLIFLGLSWEKEIIIHNNIRLNLELFSTLMSDLYCYSMLRKIRN